MAVHYKNGRYWKTILYQAYKNFRDKNMIHQNQEFPANYKFQLYIEIFIIDSKNRLKAQICSTIANILAKSSKK